MERGLGCEATGKLMLTDCLCSHVAGSNIYAAVYATADGKPKTRNGDRACATGPAVGIAFED